MRFPSSDKLALPVHFERYIPGRRHPDGRRYLPQLILRAEGGTLLGVVDRHHYVDAGLEGCDGVAQLVFLLGTITLQRRDEPRLGMGAAVPGRIETAPSVHGRVIEVPAWELRSGNLPYQALLVELLLEIGIGVVGVRTTITADDVAERLGTRHIEPDDLITVQRSRIDILGFRGERREARGKWQ